MADELGTTRQGDLAASPGSVGQHEASPILSTTRGTDSHSGPRIVNAMSVDVEDYYQVSALACRVRREDWDGLESRVVRNTENVLRLFAEAGVSATFFTLGCVAERHPSLIRRIVDAGHELASHGYAHWRVSDQAPAAFAEDIRRTKALLEDVGGVPVRGFRAASFSIGANTPWAFEILADEGYAYSSSVYPIRHDHYGLPQAPRFAFKPVQGAQFLEIPISTVSLLGRKLPCGGGGYFRFLPYALSRWSLQRVNRQDRQPCIFYWHPWEIDVEQPRVQGLPFRSRFRHYVNLDRMEGRLQRLLRDLRWDRIDRLFLAGGAAGE